MTKANIKLLAGTALAALLASGVEAYAGGFGIHEQSTTGLGLSFAGVAAGGTPSSMFWNPATMTQMRGISTESDFTVIWPNSKVYTSPFPGSTFGPGSPSPALPLFQDQQANLGNWALVPASYMMMQLRPDLWIGMSVNSPFGLSTSFQNNWPGRFYGQQTSLTTFNATPSIAYKLNDMISFGAGVQVEYALANLNFGLPVASAINSALLNLSGSGWGYGFTAGVTVTPWAGTELGVGYRSFINQQINGTMTTPPGLPGTTLGSISSTVRLPDIVNGGIRQRINDSFTLLGTVEWTNWKRIGTSAVNFGNGGPALVLGVPVTLPFQFRDGWLFSGGFEYAMAPTWTFRAGAAYEISPITDAVRIPALPDANRIWLSGGVTKTLLPGLNMDFSYAHIFVDNANIAITPTSGNPWFNGAISYTGTVSSHIDIFSVGLRMQLAPPPPKPLITKG